MNLVADESVDQAIVVALRQEGHDVLYIAEVSPSIPDDDVLLEANQRSALLVTADKDFGELVFRLKQVHSGVILLRLSGLDAQQKCDAVSLALRDHGSQLVGSFSVISPGLLRIRS